MTKKNKKPSIGLAMSKKPKKLIELARNYKMSPEEREEQRRSFAYGNAHLHDPSVTREDIDLAADKLNLTKPVK